MLLPLFLLLFPGFSLNYSPNICWFSTHALLDSSFPTHSRFDLCFGHRVCFGSWDTFWISSFAFRCRLSTAWLKATFLFRCRYVYPVSFLSFPEPSGETSSRFSHLSLVDRQANAKRLQAYAIPINKLI